MNIVFQSFEGRFSDSPRAVYEALQRRGGEHRSVWLIDPAQTEGLPPGIPTAVYGSAESIELLEHADAIVANTHTDLPWHKRPEALYLQTWHGTPLKRIHRDVLWAPEGRHEELSRDVAQWDVLVSPNRTSTPLLRGAFRFSGEVLESGYPRNDALSAPDRDAVRRRLRRALGIPDDKVAVLYAPTWRDDEVLPEGGAQFALALDLDAFARELGEDHVLLLRLHYLLTERVQAAGNAAARDVSSHPEMSELYLAADVLVTDYSSAMFDFALTGKPILLFTYDLDDYRGRQRGFYFDLAAQAAGPLLHSSGELLDAIADLDSITAAHREAYAEFRAVFCPLDDGHATERVVDILFPAPGVPAETSAQQGERP